MDQLPTHYGLSLALVQLERLISSERPRTQAVQSPMRPNTSVLFVFVAGLAATGVAYYFVLYRTL